jgi:hypothetical protein
MERKGSRTQPHPQATEGERVMDSVESCVNDWGGRKVDSLWSRHGQLARIISWGKLCEHGFLSRLLGGI